MMKFHMKPHVHKINNGAISTATAATSTVETAAVIRKSKDEEAILSIIDASISSLMVLIRSMINWNKNTAAVSIEMFYIL